MREYTLHELIKAREKCALIISRYGRCYLPIFERLEREIEQRENQENLYRKALRISTQKDTQISTQNGHHNFK